MNFFPNLNLADVSGLGALHGGLDQGVGDQAAHEQRVLDLIGAIAVQTQRTVVGGVQRTRTGRTRNRTRTRTRTRDRNAKTRSSKETKAISDELIVEYDVEWIEIERWRLRKQLKKCRTCAGRRLALAEPECVRPGAAAAL